MGLRFAAAAPIAPIAIPRTMIVHRAIRALVSSGPSAPRTMAVTSDAVPTKIVGRQPPNTAVDKDGRTNTPSGRAAASARMG